MSREIKFRAWDGEKMTTEVTIYNNRYIDCSNSDEDIFLKWHDPSEQVAIMQYTGLKDKNGKEIYEGDILEHETNYEPYKCVIEYNIEDIGSCGCCYESFEGAGFIGKILKGTKYNYSSFATEFRKMKIIGNIYENPELLNN